MAEPFVLIMVSKKVIDDSNLKISLKLLKIIEIDQNQKFFDCEKNRRDRVKPRTYLKLELKSEPRKVKHYLKPKLCVPV